MKKIVLKLNMLKAYDRVEWRSLEGMLRKLRFPDIGGFYYGLYYYYNVLCSVYGVTYEENSSNKGS